MSLTILGTGIALVLAFRPFLDPLPTLAGDWLLVPLIVAIAVVYKTIKLDDLSRLPREATILTAQIAVFMILAGAALWLLVELA